MHSDMMCYLWWEGYALSGYPSTKLKRIKWKSYFSLWLHLYLVYSFPSVEINYLSRHTLTIIKYSIKQIVQIALSSIGHAPTVLFWLTLNKMLCISSIGFIYEEILTIHILTILNIITFITNFYSRHNMLVSNCFLWT